MACRTAPRTSILVPTSSGMTGHVRVAAREGDGLLRGFLHQVAEGHSGFVAGQSAEILPGHCHARVHLVVVQGGVDEEPEN